MDLQPERWRGGVWRTVVALVALAAVAALRESVGRYGSGVAALVLLPVLWVAIRGSRRELAIVVGGVAAVFTLPAFVPGASEDLGARWPVAMFVTVACGVAGAVIQHLVMQVRRQADEAAERHQELELLVAMLGEVLRASDARAAICDAARALTKSPAAVLLERNQESRLTPTAAAGAGTDGLALDVRPDEPIWTALESGRGAVLETGDDGLDPALVAALGGPRCVALAPVVGPEVSAVLAIGLARTVDWRGEPLALLAAEAASVIGRADLLAELETLARIDSLTGLPNRRAWDEALAGSLARAARLGAPLSVIVVDLDGFKRFNDAHGHPAGDRVLKEVAAGWREQLREGDLIARWGGDEFAVLIHGGPDVARRVVDRLAARSGRLSATAGVATWDGSESAERIVSRADAALYAAKREGSASAPEA